MRLETLCERELLVMLRGCQIFLMLLEDDRILKDVFVLDTFFSFEYSVVWRAEPIRNSKEIEDLVDKVDIIQSVDLNGSGLVGITEEELMDMKKNVKCRKSP